MKISEPNSHQIEVEKLLFRPSRGFASPHIQTILPTFFSHIGEPPPSTPYFIPLDDGDILSCKLSTPPNWNGSQKTVVLLHGLGGSDSSCYMIRLSRKFYREHYRTVRVNLRGAGDDGHLAKRPYHGGSSHDLLTLVETLKKESPDSPIILIGFSLGGNIVLKLLGELKEKGPTLVEMAITICSPLDLLHTMELLRHPSNHLYHRYYVKGLKAASSRWIGKQSVRSIYDYDHVVTAPQWGFRDPEDYYQQCSSKFVLSDIRQTSHLIFAADDPFVDYRVVLQSPLSSKIKIWLSTYGGHMGFWGWAGKEHRYHWLDPVLLKMVQSC